MQHRTKSMGRLSGIQAPVTMPNMISPMMIGAKFYITAGLLLIMMAGLGVLAINWLSRSVDAIVTDPFPGIQQISRADALVFQFRGDTWKHIASADLSAKLAIEASQNETKLTIARALKEYEKTISTPRDRDLYPAMKPLCERYVGLVESEVLPLSREGKSVEAQRKYLQDSDPTHAALKFAVFASVEYSHTNGKQTR